VKNCERKLRGMKSSSERERSMTERDTVVARVMTAIRADGCLLVREGDHRGCVRERMLLGFVFVTRVTCIGMETHTVSYFCRKNCIQLSIL